MDSGVENSSGGGSGKAISKVGWYILGLIKSMLVHMHSQNYKSISRMDTSPKIRYYGMKEELNSCRCHRFLNCSWKYLYGDLNLLLQQRLLTMMMSSPNGRRRLEK
ncbi:hypothetical protein MKX01_016412 [Papaver californicum]|nr:hypothetical protein MKX01_016412 [Papaver californicum]